MSEAVDIKRWGLIFGWPVAIAAGWVVGQLTHTPWPMPMAAVGWLAVLFVTLRKDTAE